MFSEITETDKYHGLYCHSHFMITPKKWVYNMLFWLLVYVTVLLSWFQRNMFQSGLYEDTNKAADQANRRTVIWAANINRFHCHFEDSPNSKI